MRWIVTLVLALISPALLAESYTLIFDSKCSASGEKLEFKCKSEPASWAQNLTIFVNNGKWFGKEGANKNAFPLGLIKEDAYVKVFDYPVLYSGILVLTRTA